MSAAALTRALILAVALALALLGLAASAQAATIEVENENESGPGSLGQAILDAGAGDTIALPPGEYLLVNGDTLIEQQNTLQGAGVSKTTIVPSGGGEAFEPGSGVTVTDATVAEPLQDRGNDDGTGSGIESKAQVIALLGTIAFFLLILELVRRRRLVERYALLWMAAAVVLLVLAVWTSGLDVLADAMGIAEPANAIFILTLGAAFLLLLNFSVATSRLSEETKILAQETARLEQELRRLRGDEPRLNGDGSAEQAQDEPPVTAEQPRQQG